MKTNSKKGKLQRVISNPDLFENQDRIEKLKRHNNSLIKLNKYINWSFFGKEIDRQLPMVDYSKGAGHQLVENYCSRYSCYSTCSTYLMMVLSTKS